MPGGEEFEGQEQEMIRYLIISDAADFWAVQNGQNEEDNKESGTIAGGNEGGEGDAEMVENEQQGADVSNDGAAASASRVLVRPSVSGSAPM